MIIIISPRENPNLLHNSGLQWCDLTEVFALGWELAALPLVA